jgi:8-oxo-dGTP pyrophosphatase MutT (NUDIX family)
MIKDIIGKKPGWMYRQSGIIPIYIQDGIIKTIIITSTSNGFWVFPKGVIEKGMTAKDSALKEAFEEAGIRGLAFEDEIGIYEYEKWSGICEVKMYLMEVKEILDDWEDKETRKRLICNTSEAMKLINNGDLKNILGKAENEWNRKNRIE